MLNPWVTVVNHDSAIFGLLGQSVLKGHYLLMSEPSPQPYFTFPPMVPVHLAGLMLLFNNTDLQAMQLVFKSYSHLLFLASLPLFYFWTRRMLGSGHAMLLTALVAVNPIIYKYSSDILSDVPFWGFSMAALYCGWRYHAALQRGCGQPKRWLAGTLVLIVICALTRQIGMALVLGFLASLLVEKRWKVLALSTVVLTAGAVSWSTYEHFYRQAHPSDIDSLNQQGVQEVLDKSPVKIEYVKHFLVDKPVNKDENRFQTDPMILFGNIAERVSDYTKISLSQLLPPIRIKINGDKRNLIHHVGFMLLLWALFLPGLRRMFQAFPFGAAYLCIYMGVLLVYPYISQRFLLPVFPLILIGTYWGLLEGKRFLQAQSQPVLRKISTGVLPVFLVLGLIAALPPTIRYVKDGFELKVANVGPSLREGNRGYYESMLWIKEHTPENSLIISRKPPVTYFYSGRKSTAFPFTEKEDEIFAYIREKEQRYGRQYPHLYIFEDTAFGESERFLKPMVEKYADRLQLVYTEPVTQSRLWRLKTGQP